MKIAVIIPAAGLGSRFGAATPVLTGELASREGPGSPGSPTSKLDIDLAGRPVFLRAVELFLGRPEVERIILAVNPGAIDDFRLRWSDRLDIHGVTIVPGGTRERWETVLRALDAAPADCTHIAIHDAARPLTSAALIDRVFAAARRYPAVIPAVPVSSTLKRIGDEPTALPPASTDPLDAILGGGETNEPGEPGGAARPVIETVDRRGLVEAQTPQVFDAALLRRAYAPLAAGTIETPPATDDAGLIEALGEPVVTVEGESTNLKITHPADAELAAALLDRRAAATATDTARRALFGDEDED